MDGRYYTRRRFERTALANIKHNKRINLYTCCYVKQTTDYNKNRKEISFSKHNFLFYNTIIHYIRFYTKKKNILRMMIVKHLLVITILSCYVHLKRQNKKTTNLKFNYILHNGSNLATTLKVVGSWYNDETARYYSN